MKTAMLLTERSLCELGDLHLNAVHMIVQDIALFCSGVGRAPHLVVGDVAHFVVIVEKLVSHIESEVFLQTLKVARVAPSPFLAHGCMAGKKFGKLAGVDDFHS